MRVLKDYIVTVHYSVKHIQEIDPVSQPMLSAYLKEKMTDRLCRGLDFGTYLTTPIKRMFFVFFLTIENDGLIFFLQESRDICCFCVNSED